ncbi:TetR/AcrR family transcriptional regulator [Actinomadura bangladeshensis]|uniref:TetR/AcrR family transcriptional regulator n=1 Tax=Actinomadura bangladeshensis TaxID=453573 RepID=A0A4V6PA56_9ACTN|nr:TetR/AcrR family transcriptional regulator [Actinomadura bangladeshensis]TDC17606.1 TetR/AcrR family transcriptional regulator [Actinomadura bangladeshensis]
MSTDAKRAKKTSGQAARETPDRSGATSTRKQLMENEVLEHATRLFAERGFAGTSLQDVATSMGLKRPALYYYFKSKEELLDRLIVQAVTDPANQLRDIAAQLDLDPAERLHAITHRIVTVTLNHTDRFLVLVKSESELSPATRKKFDDSRREATNIVTAVIEEGIGAGLFRPVDPRVAAFTVYGICNWAAWWYNPDGHDSIESVADQLADTALAGLLRNEQSTTRPLTTRAAIAALRDDLDRLEQTLEPAPAPRRT